MTFRIWIHGLGAAFIGGGAGAVTSSFIVTQMAPSVFNFGSGFNPLMKLVAGTFFVNGLLATAAYLAKSPLP